MAGLTPTGFCAQAALDAARHADTDERMHQQALADLQAELFRVRVAVNQMRTELSRIGDAESSSRFDRDTTVTGAAHTLAGLDDLISDIHRRLTIRRPHDDADDP